MLTKQEIIDMGLKLPKTYQDCPFERDTLHTIVLKHEITGKWFSILMDVRQQLYVNVKTDPIYSELLRKQYPYIIPAYHMNKQHWNTIIIQEETEENLVKELILQSYELTK